MNSWLILIIGIIYALIGLKYLFDANVGLSLVFIGYFIGNIGLFMVGGK